MHLFVKLMNLKEPTFDVFFPRIAWPLLCICQIRLRIQSLLGPTFLKSDLFLFYQNIRITGNFLLKILENIGGLINTNKECRKYIGRYGLLFYYSSVIKYQNNIWAVRVLSSFCL